jgi:hypothetical protein
MQTEQLDLKHKGLLSARLKRTGVSLSEYSFANLYLFRKNHSYEVITNGEIFIKGRAYDGHIYLMPTAVPRERDLPVLKDLMKDVDFLFPIPEEWLVIFDQNEFEITYDEGDRDYVYTVDKMSTLRGRRLHKKRNLLSQFLAGYKHEALPLTNDRLEQARFILSEWQASSGMAPELTDYGPCLEALDRYEELVLCGGIYYADREPAGFVLGEELNKETFVLHFAKARATFKGVYQYVFNNFAKVLPPQYKYLNLEQDLNRENLRIFKSSYVPDLLLRKARVKLRTNLQQWKA